MKYPFSLFQWYGIGCSVYDAFKKLDKNKKAEILSELTKEVVQRATKLKK